MDIKDEIKKSQDYFKRLVVETGISKIIGNNIAFIECDDNYAQFDTTAGLDNVVINELGLKGIAYRNLTKFGDCSTLTVRYKLPSGNPTEYEKRKFSLDNIDEGYIYPYWSVYSYVDNDDQFIKYYAVRTKDLINYITNNLASLKKPYVGYDYDGRGRVQMIVVDFPSLCQFSENCFGIRKDEDGKWFYINGSCKL